MRNLITSTAILLCLGGVANAQAKGEWMFGLGVATVNPRSNPSGTDAGDIYVKNNVRPTLTAEYFVWDNVGVEVLAAWPFKHNIQLDGAGRIGKTKHLPPTITMHYYFTNSSGVTPFLGAGLNYTFFFKEKTKGALAGADLKLKNSFGYALHGGLNFALDDHSTFRADIRYLDIDTKAKVNGTKIGTVHIDPITFGASYLYKF